MYQTISWDTHFPKKTTLNCLFFKRLCFDEKKVRKTGKVREMKNKSRIERSLFIFQKGVQGLNLHPKFTCYFIINNISWFRQMKIRRLIEIIPIHPSHHLEHTCSLLFQKSLLFNHFGNSRLNPLLLLLYGFTKQTIEFFNTRCFILIL